MMAPEPPVVSDHVPKLPVALISGLNSPPGIIPLHVEGDEPCAAMALFTSGSVITNTVSQPFVENGAMTAGAAVAARAVNPSEAAADGSTEMRMTIPFGMSGR